MSAGRGVFLGAVSGAAGSTVLNALTYLDMTTRGRPASTTPQDAVEKMAKVSHIRIPGLAAQHRNRVAGLGPLTGLVTGVGVGVALALAERGTWKPPLVGSCLASTVGALVASNGPMTVLGVTDPRKWSVADWLADLIPHAAYGAVTASVLRAIAA